EGLFALHSAGKIHLDIKPSNVLVTPEGRVALLDFGLVTEVGTDLGARDLPIGGTASYMAPEQAGVTTVGPAADWYSFGVVVYQALTGKPPFDLPLGELLLAKQTAEPPPPTAVARGIPEDLSALASALLRPDPSARPSGVEILARLRPGTATPSVQPGSSV